MRAASRLAGAVVLAIGAARVAPATDLPSSELLEFLGEWKDDELVFEADYPGAFEAVSGGPGDVPADDDRDEDAAEDAGERRE